jgi:multidrug resistance efflux pump
MRPLRFSARPAPGPAPRGAVHHSISRNDVDTARMQRDVAAAAVQQAKARVEAQQRIQLHNVHQHSAGWVNQRPDVKGAVAHPSGHRRRNERLINNHSISRNDVDTARMQRDVAAAAVQQAKAFSARPAPGPAPRGAVRRRG